MVEDLDSLDVLMESDTEMPSPTPSEKAAAYIIVESAAEAWPAAAAADGSQHASSQESLASMLLQKGAE